MLEAAFWGLVGGLALVLGAILGLWSPASQRTIGIVMAFGAGVLISALAFELTDEAFRRGGSDTARSDSPAARSPSSSATGSSTSEAAPTASDPTDDKPAAQPAASSWEPC